MSHRCQDFCKNHLPKKICLMMIILQLTLSEITSSFQNQLHILSQFNKYRKFLCRSLIAVFWTLSYFRRNNYVFFLYILHNILQTQHTLKLQLRFSCLEWGTFHWCCKGKINGPLCQQWCKFCLNLVRFKNIFLHLSVLSNCYTANLV